MKIKNPRGRKNDRSIKLLFRYYKHVCQYCYMDKATTLDHIVPGSRGGSNALTNLTPACTTCNERKDNKLLAPKKEMVLLQQAQVCANYIIARHNRLCKWLKDRHGKRLLRSMGREDLLRRKGWL